MRGMPEETMKALVDRPLLTPELVRHDPDAAARKALKPKRGKAN
jgi:hypothetical protein